MTFAVGGPARREDVEMSAAVDFSLLRALNGKLFPVDWRGQLYGIARARGPLIGSSSTSDASTTCVAGALRVGGKGEDILQPSLTSFQHFDANAALTCGRSILYRTSLTGTISRNLALDSPWLTPASRRRIRATARRAVPPDWQWARDVGSAVRDHDIDAQAQLISLGMLARSYPKLHRGRERRAVRRRSGVDDEPSRPGRRSATDASSIR